LWFDQVDVEPRERVKFFSGLNSKHFIGIFFYLGEIYILCIVVCFYIDMPISSQWNALGHFYPIQIAQYGLSHISKWAIEKRSSKLNKYLKLENSRRFIVDQENKFIHHENKNSNIKMLENGFEFNFPGKNK